jgi:4-diphosphocytidyl-2-C-methyl-D-erythritol kinase
LSRSRAVAETANAKVNLVLRVGPPRDDGLHPLCSLFAALDLADEVIVEPGGEVAPPSDAASGAATAIVEDEVICPGVAGDNLAAAAAAAFRAAVPGAGLPPLRIEIRKRIPVAAGLGGGSADAAAVLRAANEIAGSPLGTDGLRELAARLGSDVPSQVEPGHALVSGVGERVERVDLPAMTLVLVPQGEGLSTAAVYAELDRIGGHAGDLEAAPLRPLARRPVADLAAGLANDLQPAALSLRPELADAVDALRAAGALGAQVSGSGPTTFGVFTDRATAERAAEAVGERRAAAAAAGGSTGPSPPPIVTELLA